MCRKFCTDFLLIIIIVFVTAAAGSKKHLSRPEQIHLSYGDSHDKMVVMWSSREHAVGKVHYGPSLNATVESHVAELPMSDYKAAKYIHRAILTNLESGLSYHYKISLTYDNNVTRVSDTYKFNASSPTQNGVTKFLVYGDMGAEDKIPTFRLIEKLVASRDYTAIWHVGDIGYDLHSNYGKVGDQFMTKVQPFAATIPYMTSPGNHEIAGDFQHYRTRFSTPGTDWPIPLGRMWYSYDVGLVHFISYSTEVFFTYNEDFVCEQFDWLRQDLIRANQNRTNTPWIVAIGHRPMYCSNNNGDDCTNRFMHRWVRYGLEDLFHAQGVDLILEAHEHSYERLWPVYRGQVYHHNYQNPRASVHIISGAAGTNEGVDWMTSGPRNPWSAFKADSSSRYTIGRLSVHNSTHLHFEQMDSLDERLLDSFWLVQHDHGPFVRNVTCGGSDAHPSCACPAPIRYLTYIISVSTALVIVLLCVVTVIVCCVRRQRKRNNALLGQYKTPYRQFL